MIGTQNSNVGALSISYLIEYEYHNIRSVLAVGRRHHLATVNVIETDTYASALAAPHSGPLQCVTPTTTLTTTAPHFRCLRQVCLPPESICLPVVPQCVLRRRNHHCKGGLCGQQDCWTRFVSVTSVFE